MPLYNKLMISYMQNNYYTITVKYSIYTVYTI